MMNPKEFKQLTLTSSYPPLLQALWHDAHGRWAEAHDLAQEVDDVNGAWVHAYLHRKEGDISNAGYWYRRANRPMPSCSLDEEWEKIVNDLLLQN